MFKIKIQRYRAKSPRQYYRITHLPLELMENLAFFDHGTFDIITEQEQLFLVLRINEKE